MLALIRHRGHACVDGTDFSTLRVSIGTATGTPTWPGAHDRPRVLAEVPGVRWKRERYLGFAVIVQVSVVVDDREFVRPGVRDLSPTDQDCTVAGEALERIPAACPDVAVLDVRVGYGTSVAGIGCREMTVLQSGQRRGLICTLKAGLRIGVDSNAFHPWPTFDAPLAPGVPADVPPLMPELEAVATTATLSA